MKPCNRPAVDSGGRLGIITHPMTREVKMSTSARTSSSTKALGLAGLLLAASASASMAQAPTTASPTFVTATMPVYAQMIRFRVPVSYAPAFSKNNEGKFYIFEMVPKGETVDRWTSMMTITGQNGAVTTIPPLRDYIGNFFSRYQKACTKTFSAKPISDAKINGHAAVLVYFSCGQLLKAGYGPEGYSESVVIAFIQGAKDLYTVQWAARGAGQDKPIPFDAAKWQSRLDLLHAVRLCEKVPGEAAPYPSCIAVK